jgi:hypothetical protein
MWDVFQTGLTLLSCAFYVCEVYGVKLWESLVWFFTSAFTLDALLHFYVADDK